MKIQTLDRSTPPIAHRIEHTKMPWPQKVSPIKDGMPMFVLDMGKDSYVRLELMFDAGKWYDPHCGVAYFTANMLLEGTKNRTAQEIAQYLDQYGTEVEVKVNDDTSSITLFTLSKFLEPVLELLSELLLESTFPESRLDHLKQLEKQSLALQAVKVNSISAKKFKEALFTTNHPYGKSLTEDDVDAINSKDLKQYYNDQFMAKCTVLVCGQIDSNNLELIKKYLCKLPIHHSHGTKSHSIKKLSPATLDLNARSGLQASINIGKILFNQTHPDYMPMIVLNALLGGYIGSRLMLNIREKKGYTYGIYSKLVSLKHSGYFVIKADVAQEFTKDACKEIENEIKILQTVPASTSEIELLQNHILGQLLFEMDSPFVIMEKFKSLHLQGLDHTFYDKLIDVINSVEPKQIMMLAAKHLDPSTFNCVTVY